jgi:PAS domain S-box-containing protein
MDSVLADGKALTRTQRTAISVGLFVAIAALAVGLPEQRIAYAEIVPLILVARAYGLLTSMITAAVLAPALTALERHGHVAAGDWPTFALECFFPFAVFTAVLVVVERYEEVLLRTHRSEAERLSWESERQLRELAAELPDAVRREEQAARERDLAAIAEAIPQLVWRARGDGRSEYFNSAWTEFTGLSVEDLGVSFDAAIHPDDAPQARRAWSDALGQGVVFDAEFRLRARDGSYRWFLARATPLRDWTGAIVRWFGTCTDIDSHKRAQERLEKQFEIAHRVSEAFQEASLPPQMPVVPGVCFSALYKAGRREAAVGGDWYDALRLLDGRVIVSIGDVAGSGLGAALTMVAMRQAIRGAAQIHAEPLSLLEAADRTLRPDAPDRMVTAFVGVYDPVTRLLNYASAGHPPPMVRGADGTIVELSAPGLPLGVRRKGDCEAREIVLEPGALLVLYTDGLVESTHDYAAGERRLRAAIGRLEPFGPAILAQSIARSCLGGEARDDVAILTLAFEPSIDSHQYRRWTFDSSDRFAAREIRAAFEAAVVGAGANEEQLADAEVVFAELLGNVVRHARGPCDVVLDATGTLPVLSVLDRGRGFTHAAHLPADAFAESGRGLYIVRSLTAEFNASRRPGGGTHARAVLYVERLVTPPRKRVALETSLV